jgi:hypothetical protein
MRYAATILLPLALAGCAGDAAPDVPVAPSAPQPPGSPPAVAPVTGAFVWGAVVARDGGCIVGATVRAVGGQALGDSVTQQGPCSPWDDEGGFVFGRLTPGVALTIRASAAGYVAKEVTVIPDRGPQTATVVVLDRAVP